MSTSAIISSNGRRWQRYPAYKDCGIAWLGKLPSMWAVVPLKYIASLKGRLGWQGLRADEYTQEGPYLVTSEHFTNDRVHWQRCHHVTQERYEIAPEIQLRPHDLLMMKDGAAMGKLAYVDDLPGPACLNSHLLLFRPRNGRYVNRFLYYVLGSPIFTTFMVQERTGTTFFGISQESIGSFSLAVPPLAEQYQIITFLDRETAKIDALIVKKERLIELLQEKRTALISHAVTKGIDPSVPLKDSGVAWLGKIPPHWRIIQSRRVFRVRNESATESDEQLTASQKYGMIPQTQFMELEGRRVVVTIKGVESLRHVEPNDFVISLRSFQGGIEWCKVSGSVTFHYVVLKPAKPLHPAFFGYLFKSSVFIQALRATTDFIRDGQDLRYSHFVLVPLPVVPLHEQAAIASYLDRETAKLDALVNVAQQTIEKLREYRTALISAAVTGKIDVREEVV